MLNSLSFEDPHMFSKDLANYYREKLKMRLHGIEDVVDIHLNLIGGLNKNLERSYMYKLAVLEANEEKITKSEEYCLRMHDAMQSYNLYDSAECYQVKLAVDKIDRQLLDMDFLDVELPVSC